MAGGGVCELPQGRCGRTLRIGLISDTHNLLRAQARQALAGVDHILHAGDICGPHVLQELSAIAPVTAVRGNNDAGMWAQTLRVDEALQIGGAMIYMLHDIGDIEIDPRAAGFQVVITGHSHRPLIDERDGVLFVNPGSAGPRRFTLPVALALMQITDGRPSADIRFLQLY